MARFYAVALLALSLTTPSLAQVAKEPGTMRFEGKLSAALETYNRALPGKPDQLMVATLCGGTCLVFSMTIDCAGSESI